MNEKSLTVLEKYDLEIKSTYRLKGNYGCETKSGKYILQEYNNSNEKMKTMKILYCYLEENGFRTDSVIENKEGQFVSVSDDGYTYILKKWFDAQECSINDESHVCMGARNLARFHKYCENTGELWEEHKGFHPGLNMIQAFERHNKEIIHIRNYIKRRRNKNYFEMALQKIIEPYHIQAVEALEKLKNSSYQKSYEQAVANMTLNHGSYNYHNLILDGNNVIMVNMMKINYAPQLQDLYGFLRKVMEKNQWNPELGNKVLKAYENEKKITEEEKDILKAMFCYPEKFWKIINYYYNSNKSWYSEKNEDKLNQFRKQENLRWNFIENMQD